METLIALKEAMQRAGVRNADVARACNISPQAVHQWFVKGTGSRDHLMVAARLCGTTLSELSGVPDPSRPLSPDLGMLKRAVSAVKEVLDRDGKTKDIAPEDLAEMIVYAYEGLIQADKAKQAVEQKISQLMQSSRSVKDPHSR